MSINEEEIVFFDQQQLFSEESILQIFDEEPENQARIKGLFVAKAKEFGLAKEMRDTIKAYTRAEKQLSDEYKKNFAKEHTAINLDFDGQGKPLNTIENFVKVLENDYFHFDFMKDIESKVYEVENTFVLKKIDNTYKIISLRKVQDFYVMITNEYKTGKSDKDAKKESFWSNLFI